MENNQIQELLKKFREGNCTEEEKAMIEYWAHHMNEEGDAGLTDADMAEAEKQMWNNIKPAKTSSRRQYWSAAAAVLVFVSLGIAVRFYFKGTTDNSKELNKIAAVNTIKPGSNNAVLILANGEKINLNQASNGQIASHSGMRISKQADGKLIYTVAPNTTGNTTAQLAYNTLQTPRGGQYQLNLPDGSKVWLNAASSIRFPLQFDKRQRMVELAGEGYFEIAHITAANGKRLPFMVKTVSTGSNRRGQLVEVLGTHFNINAYNDESSVKTTLLEGSVQVWEFNGDNNDISSAPRLLKPGQQSVLNGSGVMVINADTEAAIAWKNGYFRFNDESLESIMRKVSKWYDVDVTYQSEDLKKESFAGVTTRFTSVNELLKMLELTNVVKFKVEGRKIEVVKK